VTTSLTRTSFRSFEESTAQDWAFIVERERTLQESLADNVMAQMQLLTIDHGGFPVSRMEHSLQTATRAERDGRDEEYVLCALLHDIGDGLAPLNHPAIAAAILEPYVSEANHWMVAKHGIFQGYYFWHHLGGDRHAREAHRSSPFFDHAAEFCAKYDQVAFDADYRSEPLEHFEPLVRSLLAPKG
jgi:predicted HD phosphohydrolase